MKRGDQVSAVNHSLTASAISSPDVGLAAGLFALSQSIESANCLRCDAEAAGERLRRVVTRFVRVTATTLLARLISGPVRSGSVWSTDKVARRVPSS